MTLQALHDHTTEHHKIVTGILRYVSRNADVPYPEVRDDFASGGLEITSLFWDMLYDIHPGRFVGVFWCHGCRRFGLHEKIH